MARRVSRRPPDLVLQLSKGATVVQVTGAIGPTSSSRAEEVVLTLVSLQSVQAFRLLLKTSVEGNAQEFNQFLVGFAVWLSPSKFCSKIKALYKDTHVYSHTR